MHGLPLQPRRRLTFPARLGVLLLACGWLLGPAPAALADAILVNSPGDTFDPSHPCNLRDAITAANTNSPVHGCAAGQTGLDTIHFNWGLIFCPLTGCRTILTSPLPKVTEDLTIDGIGQFPIISGNNLYRIFDFDIVSAKLANLYLLNAADSAVHLDGATLALDHMHVSNSHASFGGAISQESGTLSVTHSEFISNTAVFGGALNQTGGAAIVSSSSFTANVATGASGGAISVIGFSRLDVSGSLFGSNRALQSGGAIYAQDLQVHTRVDSSTFRSNRTLTPTATVGGGAIYNVGVLTLTNSTLTENATVSDGGALYVLDGQATVSNSTFTGNTARGSGGAIAGFSGGAPFPAVLSLNNATLSDNTADLDNNNFGDGGGLAVTSALVTVTVSNAIIAGNFDTPNNLGVGAIHPDCSGQLAALHFTLIGLSDGCTVAPGQSSNNKVGTSLSPLDALLGPLADNGGSTQTRALLPGSPALNAGSPAAPGSGGLACEPADQRGLPRPNGFACDMGTFEAGGRLYLPAVRR